MNPRPIADPTRREFLRRTGLGSALVLGASRLAQADEAGWRPLFDGKSMAGWTPKIKGHALGENFADTFRVEDGLLKVRYDGYKQFDETFGHLFYEAPFSKYLLRIEYRFVGEQCPGGPGWALRNSGVMIHSQKPETMPKDQDFPVSIEVQFLGGNGKDERPTGNLCTPGTHVVMGGQLLTRHCTNSKSKTYHGDQWVTVEVEAHGDRVIRHKVDGQTVIEYEQPQLDPGDATAKPLIHDGKLLLAGGYLALQAESHPIDFRRVEIKELAE